MSELTLKHAEHGNYRRQLLATASAFVLIGSVYGAGVAQAQDDDHPTVWIELGGQLERVQRAEEQIAPAFALRAPRPAFETTSPISLLRAPRYSVGGEGKLTFEPSGSNWVFVAAIRYGRSNGKKHFHNQTYAPVKVGNGTIGGIYVPGVSLVTPGRFEDSETKFNEAHTIIDFAAGKDVGLGLFGNAVASLGVRYAQFSMASTVSLSSKPDFLTHRTFNTFGKYVTRQGFHLYRAGGEAERNFHGVGPSLSLSGSMPLSGTQDGGIAFDWGVNGAVLFGRQRTTTEHYTYVRYRQVLNGGADTNYNLPHARNSTHAVTVPNLGAFAGLSMRYTNAKVSFGYRADVFFGAMDGGLDTRKSYDRSFYGPFATISIGLGG